MSEEHKLRKSAERKIKSLQESFETAKGAAVFGVEFLPGQFDQRADSAVQCVQFLNSAEKPVIRTAVIYVIEGNTTEAELASVKKVRKLNTRTILLSMMRPGTFVKSEGCSITSPDTPVVL